MSIEQKTQEAVDRLRRIETRLTAYLVENGMRINAQTPEWDGDVGAVYVDRLDCPLSAMINAVPTDCGYAEVNVIVDGETVAVLLV